MVFEVFSLIAVAVYVLIRFDAWLGRRILRQQAIEEAALRAAQAALDAQVPATTRLRIAGTRALPRNQHARLARFGIQPDRGLELFLFDSCAGLPAWPGEVLGALRKLYRLGQVRGPEVTALLAGPGYLPDGLGLYFALLDNGPDRAPEVLAFVDRLPASTRVAPSAMHEEPVAMFR
jgi:hypothetical protein